MTTIDKFFLYMKIDDKSDFLSFVKISIKEYTKKYPIPATILINEIDFPQLGGCRGASFRNQEIVIKVRNTILPNHVAFSQQN